MAAPLTNVLLESLPPRSHLSMLDAFETVSLPLGTVFYEVESKPLYLHFLTSGIASVVIPMSSGEAAEVSMIGREGVVGDLNLLGPQVGGSRCMMQLAGTGLRIEKKEFQRRFDADELLRRRVLRHVHYQTNVLAQVSACNRLHEAEERLARWLLMVADRTGDPEMALTQEFLAEMIGTRRSTVTLIAGTLQRAGMIEYTWGRIRIVDRPRLEDTACECNKVVRKLYHHLYK